MTWLWTQALSPQCDRTPPPPPVSMVGSHGERLRDLDTNTWMSSSPQYSSRISVHVGLIIRDNIRGGALLEYLGGWFEFLEINIFVGKIGKINKWPQGLVGIQPILK